MQCEPKLDYCQLLVGFSRLQLLFEVTRVKRMIVPWMTISIWFKKKKGQGSDMPNLEALDGNYECIIIILTGFWNA